MRSCVHGRTAVCPVGTTRRPGEATQNIQLRLPLHLVILIHGLGGNRADTLAVIPARHDLGFPVLAIAYRNDVGAPASPDHQNHLGASEWHDVDAAVRYAPGQPEPRPARLTPYG